MKHFISKLFAGPERPDPPEGLIYAIGDIHGRHDLLVDLLEMIMRDCSQQDAEIIFLGDYIDRGPHSAQVIDTLIELRSQTRLATALLKGNHEATFMDFLKDPMVGPAWAQFGGSETLASYGVSPPQRQDEEDWRGAHQALLSRLPQAHLCFFEALDLYAERGCYFFVHAGINPKKSLEEQDERELLWIRDEFLESERKLPRIVVHGHTPQEHPSRDSNRIGLDTGAYISNRLTAARIEGLEVKFLTAK